jgi:hypothetical protein
MFWRQKKKRHQEECLPTEHVYGCTYSAIGPATCVMSPQRHCCHSNLAATARKADNPAIHPAQTNAATKPTCAAACLIMRMLSIHAGMAICSSYLYST